MMRDVKGKIMGRIMGRIVDFFPNTHEDEFWEDKKFYDVKFPKHNDIKVYPVHTFPISQLRGCNIAK